MKVDWGVQGLGVYELSNQDGIVSQRLRADMPQKAHEFPVKRIIRAGHCYPVCGLDHEVMGASYIKQRGCSTSDIFNLLHRGGKTTH